MRREVRAQVGVLALLGVLALFILPLPGRAQTLPNDFALYKLGWPDSAASMDPNVYQPGAVVAQESFARFASELALTIVPLPNPPETLGQSGFEFSLSEDFAYIHPNQKLNANGAVVQVWPFNSGDTNELYLTTFHFRKGLPLSLEFDADFSYIARSSMVVPTAGLKWAFLEGIKYVPDFAMHAFCSVLLGEQSLSIVAFGWDMSIGYHFPIWHSGTITPIFGYQMVGMDATTSNINFDPGHYNPLQPNNSDSVFAELPYANFATRFNRIFFGVEGKWNILVVGIDAADGWGTNAIGVGYSEQYSVQMWKVGLRAGVRF